MLCIVHVTSQFPLSPSLSREESTTEQRSLPRYWEDESVLHLRDFQDLCFHCQKSSKNPQAAGKKKKEEEGRIKKTTCIVVVMWHFLRRGFLWTQTALLPHSSQIHCDVRTHSLASCLVTFPNRTEGYVLDVLRVLEADLHIETPHSVRKHFLCEETPEAMREVPRTLRKGSRSSFEEGGVLQAMTLVLFSTFTLAFSRCIVPRFESAVC